ncbi:MAG: PQQ-dependent sugar dehydrogenase [Saprospiraceae bacterium]|nr:PQQ-dependent sugar dehydrogenase [Saprospiraceae bacterium]
MIKFTLLVFFGSVCYFEAISQLALETYVTGLTQPVDIANAGDGSDRLFVVERSGRIRIIDSTGALMNGAFLDITSKVDDSGGEEGLLGLVFHPAYATNGFFFVYYTRAQASVGQAIIERYTVSSDPNIADAASSAEVMTISQPQENHNGGDMAFGPAGNLYIGIGDGGSGNDPGERSQDLTRPLGKMLRINVDQLPYGVPSDNPFSNASGDTLKTIWARGLRNPWRFSFDTHFNLWIGDVGQSAREEINYISEDLNIPGLNYGWDCREGDLACPGCGNNNCSGLNFTEPVYWYGPGPGLSVTGGYVLEGDYYDAFEGSYIFADFVLDEIRTLKINSGRSVTVSEAIDAPNISTFGKDESGRIYAANYSGIIYRVVETGLLPVELISVKLERHERQILLDWETGFELTASHFEVERSFASGAFKQIGVVPSQVNSNVATSYQFVDEVPIPGQYFYRLKSIDLDGSFTYSMTLSTEVMNGSEITVIPNPAVDKITVFISGMHNYGVLQIISLDGSVMKQLNLENTSNAPIDININDLKRGLVMVQFTNGKGQKTTRKLMLY